MDLTTILILALGLPAALYAHVQLPQFVATRAGIVAARGILIVVGSAFGYVAVVSAAGATPAWPTFLAGFGAVHVPAAVILFIKRARRSPKT